MFLYDQIKILHLELTDRCNANCPMCPRSVHGAFENPNLCLTELSLEDIKNFFPQEFVAQLDYIYLCGNYGEPTVARDCLEILKYFRESNPQIRLSVFTNGSTRTTQWWSEVGRLLSRSGDLVRFSIDGLESTNHLYRQNTNWDKIISNAKAFINAGGVAYWDYLVFDHNKHQIEEAKSLAKTLGFSEFFTKYSSRFVNNQGQTIIEEYPVYDKTGEFVRKLMPIPELYGYDQAEVLSFERQQPIQPTLNPLKKWVPDLSSPDHQASYLSKCVSCQSQRNKEIYISAEGFVTPCCWTAFTIRTAMDIEHLNQFRGMVFDNGLDNICLRKKSLQEIIGDDFFQNQFTSNWAKKTPAEGQLMLCYKFCNTDSWVQKEFKNREIL